MADQDLRLGDLIDDYCKRCRLLMNHYVVSMVNGEVIKVRCQTCHHEHDYLHGQAGEKKKNSRKSLFDQVAATLPTTNPSPKDTKPKKGRDQ